MKPVFGGLRRGLNSLNSDIVKLNTEHYCCVTCSLVQKSSSYSTVLWIPPYITCALLPVLKLTMISTRKMVSERQLKMILLYKTCALLPVLKLTMISTRKMVSERQLKMILLMERSSLKNEIATGRIIRFATRRSSIHRSQ